MVLSLDMDLNVTRLCYLFFPFFVLCSCFFWSFLFYIHNITSYVRWMDDVEGLSSLFFS